MTLEDEGRNYCPRVRNLSGDRCHFARPDREAINNLDEHVKVFPGIQVQVDRHMDAPGLLAYSFGTVCILYRY